MRSLQKLHKFFIKRAVEVAQDDGSRNGVLREETERKRTLLFLFQKYQVEIIHEWEVKADKPASKVITL